VLVTQSMYGKRGAYPDVLTGFFAAGISRDGRKASDQEIWFVVLETGCSYQHENRGYVGGHAHQVLMRLAVAWCCGASILLIGGLVFWCCCATLEPSNALRPYPSVHVIEDVFVPV
jgi:hypothetical protein